MASMSKYEKVKSDIKRKIETGEYVDRDRIPSENEIINQYEVSRITASRALSDLALEGFIYRVQGKGSFVTPSEERIDKMFLQQSVGGPAAQPAHAGILKIGVVIPGISDYHGMSIVSGITGSLRYPDYFVTITSSLDNHVEDYAINLFLANRFDAMIIFPVDTEMYNDTILAMQASRFPFVLVDRNFPRVNSNYVICDNRLGAESATEHLISLGHKRIAFCSSATTTEQTTGIRFEGFQRAMKKHGIPLGLGSDMTKLYANPAMKDRLKAMILNGNITAAVASNSMVGKDLYELCSSMSMNVPADFSIVCFDNTSAFSSMSDFFTFVEQHSFEMGVKASEIVQQMMRNGKKPSSPVQVVLKPTLVVNHSTAPAKN